MTIEHNENDLFSYAYRYVNNKSILARMGHSEIFHDIRSAYNSSGSRWSKLVKLAGATLRGTAGAIPIPVVGGLVAAAEAKLESYFRSQYHIAKSAAASTDEIKIKFDIKEMSVENLDRYRWKVSDATLEHNTAAANLTNGHIADYASKGKTCQAYTEYALAAAQYIRRVKILFNALIELNVVIVNTVKWLDNLSLGSTTAAQLDNQKTITTDNATGGAYKVINDNKVLIATAIQNEWTAIETAAKNAADQEERDKQAADNETTAKNSFLQNMQTALRTAQQQETLDQNTNRIAKTIASQQKLIAAQTAVTLATRAVNTAKTAALEAQAKSDQYSNYDRTTFIKETVKHLIYQKHHDCGDWCCFKFDVKQASDTVNQITDQVAKVVKAVASPIVPDSCTNNCGNLWQTD